jgi:hypothetical protein
VSVHGERAFPPPQKAEEAAEPVDPDVAKPGIVQHPPQTLYDFPLFPAERGYPDELREAPDRVFPV